MRRGQGGLLAYPEGGEKSVDYATRRVAWWSAAHCLPQVLAAAPRAHCRDSASQEQESQSCATVWQSRSKTVKEEDSEDLTLFYLGFFGYFFQNHVAPRKKFNYLIFFA